MKVGTDAVLLGSWVNPSIAKNILDVGTGSGVVALMLAQKSNAKIDAIEIDENSYLQAKENFENSKWSDRLKSINESLQSYQKKTDKKYDLIVSNPPYFVNSLKSNIEQKNIARHNINLTFEELIFCSAQLLSNSGSLYLIIPSNEAQNIINISEKNKLYCTEKLDIKPKESSDPKRSILKFETVQKKLICHFLTIEHSERHDYTEEYKELTKDFYLNL